MRVLVLESPWETDDLSDGTSVKPFFEGWSDLNEVDISYRMYHGSDDLAHWIRRFVLHPRLKICYIAGHGNKGRLAGLRKDINLDAIANLTKIQGPHGNTKKGILFGACDVGVGLEKFLYNCGKRIKWVAGYDRNIPWLEATICDILFIQYMTAGKVKNKGDSAFYEKKSNFEYEKPPSASLAAKWIKKDYKLAIRCGFRAIDR